MFLLSIIHYYVGWSRYLIVLVIASGHEEFNWSILLVYYRIDIAFQWCQKEEDKSCEVFITHWLTCFMLVFHASMSTNKTVWVHKEKGFVIIKKGEFVGIYAFLMIDKERRNMVVNTVQRYSVMSCWIWESF